MEIREQFETNVEILNQRQDNAVSIFCDWFPLENIFFQSQSRGIRGGGRAPALLLMSASLRGGHSWGGALLLLHLLAFPFLRQSSYSTLHCIALTQTQKLRKELKYIYWFTTILFKALSDQLYYIKYPCFPFWKLIIFICVSSTKVTNAFLASETMEKWRFQRYIGQAIL